MFAGQRDDPFFVDLGGTFDLLGIRGLDGNSSSRADSLKGFNVHSIALEIPIERLSRSGTEPTSPNDPAAIIGVWATASRPSMTTRAAGSETQSGSWVQVTRLGQPLVNEVVIPRALKDAFNGLEPTGDAAALPVVLDPEVPKLLEALFGILSPPAPRNDLVTIFLTGIPGLNQPQNVRPSEMLRLNMAIPPTSRPSLLGVLSGDLAGFPNGRRLTDDVVDIALRAMAGATPLTPDFNAGMNARLGDGVDRSDVGFSIGSPTWACRIRATSDKTMTTRQPKNSPTGRRRVVVAMFVALAAAGGVAGVRSLQSPPTLLAIAPSERAAMSASITSRDGLSQAMATLTARVAANAADDQAAVALADVLMRQARVSGDGSLPMRAEVVLTSTIAATDSYLGRRMLGAVYLAQHRFLGRPRGRAQGQADASGRPVELRRHRRCRHRAGALRRGVCGVRSHGLAQARRRRVRPNRVRARAAGQPGRGLTAMRMAIEATSPQDPEGIAWAWSQLGALHLQKGEIDQAATAYDRALFAFPRHPYARAGQARVAVARGDFDRGLAIYREQLALAPTPELAAQIGDLLQRRGDDEGARAAWAEAERLERDGWKHESPQPAALARLLAERDLQPEQAVRLAREAARDRDDIFTNDALAWSLYEREPSTRPGRHPSARAAPARATAASCITRRRSLRRAGTRQRRAPSLRARSRGTRSST